MSPYEKNIQWQIGISTATSHWGILFFCFVDGYIIMQRNIISIENITAYETNTPMCSEIMSLPIRFSSMTNWWVMKSMKTYLSLFNMIWSDGHSSSCVYGTSYTRWVTCSVVVSEHKHLKISSDIVLPRCGIHWDERDCTWNTENLLPD